MYYDFCSDFIFQNLSKIGFFIGSRKSRKPAGNPGNGGFFVLLFIFEEKEKLERLYYVNTNLSTNI